MTKVVEVNGVKLSYEEQGSGEETVVFGHGGLEAANGWREVLELVPAKYHAYAIDMRGHGKSADVTENVTIPQMADDVYQFSLELGLGKFVYVGVSQGGGVGIQLVIDHPEVLKGAVLVSPVPAHGLAMRADVGGTGLLDPEVFRATFEEFLVKGLSEERLQERTNTAMLMKKEAWLSAQDSMEHFDMEDRVGEIKVPVMMTIAGKDNIIPPDDQWRTVKQIPGAKAVFFEDEGHLMFQETPQRLVREILFFIDQLE